jgi:hypothetical protein
MKRLRILGILLLFALALTACWPLDQVTKPIDKVNDTLNKAIDNLGNESSAWRSILQTTVSELKQEGSDLADRVETLLTDSINVSTSAIDCLVSQLGSRIKDELTNILNGYLGKPLVTLAPRVCAFSPANLVLQWDSTQTYLLNTPATQLVTIFGYNFRNLDLPEVYLHTPEGTNLPTQVIASLQTTYKVQLNFQREDFSRFQPGYQYQIVWKTVDETDTLNAIIPPKAIPPKLAVTFDHMTLYEDEESGDTNMALYIYEVLPSGRALVFSWNDGCNKVNETNEYDLHSGGTGQNPVIITTATTFTVEGYHIDDQCWPNAGNNENNLGAATLTIDPTNLAQVGKNFNFDPTITDNNNKGYQVTVATQQV